MSLQCCNFETSPSSSVSSLSYSFCECKCYSRGKNLALQFIGRVLSRRPFLILVVTLCLAGLLSWLGVSQFGFPEFDDPYVGFETRFTPISNRLAALGNLRREVNRLELLENYPGEKLTGREWRRKRQSDELVDADTVIGGNLCTTFPLQDYSRIALELKPSAYIFSQEVLSLICYFQKLTEEISGYTDICEHDDDRMCCSMWSLPNYIALFVNKRDCASIQMEDIDNFNQNLSLCQELYKNETKHECYLKTNSCPEMCHRGGILHTALYYNMDKNYTSTNITKFTMIVLPVPKSPNIRPLIEHFQDSISRLQLPGDSVFLTGFDFGGKDWLFKRYLLTDLQYVVSASVVIFVIVCLYTKSVFVTAVSFGVLTLSLGVAYFLYMSVFRVPYFPFMNMLVTIIVMGVGTDGTLIFSIVWQRLKSQHLMIDKKVREEMMIVMLTETTGTLFITTCTTAGAFFASLTSSITTIRCFSIFAGTTIIVGFVLLYICVPTTLVLSDSIWSYICSLMPESRENKGKFYSKLVQVYERIQSVEVIFSHTIPATLRYIMEKLAQTKLYILSLLLFMGVLIWACIIVFHNPQFQLPNTEQFQLLFSNHPVEKYDREVEPSFSTNWNSEYSAVDSEMEKITAYFVWGVQSVDTGYGLDPTDDGELVFDPNFSMENVSSQKWMRKLCNKLRKQAFYDEVANSVVGMHYDSCFLDTMIKWMKRECEHAFLKNETYKPCCKVSKFPYDREVFSKCVGLAARDVYRTPTLYFQPDIAGPKFFVLKEENTTEKSGQLATFIVRVKTNVSLSLSYEKMNTFYTMVETFFNQELSSSGGKVPKGLENGFFVSAHLDFYDLQRSLLNDTWQSFLLSAGLCFLLIWLSSCSLCVAIGAVISIFAIVAVSSAVLIQLFNWKLGVFESIAVTVAVGLSDFTAHHAIEFSKRKSVIEMTSPTFFSAVTTGTMGLFMLMFSNVLVYQQIGSFFFVLVVVSWLYSVFFLSPILTIFDKIVNTCKAAFKYICNGKESLIHDQGMDDRVIRNNRGSSLNSFEDYLERSESDSNLNSNLESCNLPDKKQSIMMEKWKLLKKFAQETTV